MDQAISPAQVHESAEIGDAGDLTMSCLPLSQFFYNPLALQFLPGTESLPLGKNQAAAMAVHFNDLEPYPPPDHSFQALAALLFSQTLGQPHDLRGRDKATNLTKLNYDTTAVVTGDLPLVEFVVSHHLLSLGPVLVQAGLVDGQDGMPFPILGAKHER